MGKPRNIYSLMFYDAATKKENIIDIPTNGTISSKTDITYIDLFVLGNCAINLDKNNNYKEEDLKSNFINFLNSSDNQYTKETVPADAYLYITYKHDKDIKYLDVIYKSEDLKEFANIFSHLRKSREDFYTKNDNVRGDMAVLFDRQVYLNLDKEKYFNDYFNNRVCFNIEKNSTFTHISWDDRKYLGNTLVEKINDYSRAMAKLNKEFDQYSEVAQGIDDSEKNLKDHLRQYKNLRGLIIYFENQYVNKTLIEEARANKTVAKFGKRVGASDVEFIMQLKKTLKYKIEEMKPILEKKWIDSSVELENSNKELNQIGKAYSSNDYDDGIMLDKYEELLRINSIINNGSEELSNLDDVMSDSNKIANAYDRKEVAKVKVKGNNGKKLIIDDDDRNMIYNPVTGTMVEHDHDLWRK